MTDTGIPSWTAPSGRTYPPIPRDITSPILPTAYITNNQDNPEEPADREYRGDLEDLPWPTLPEDPDADTWWQHLQHYLASRDYTIPDPEAQPPETTGNCIRYPDAA